MYDGGCLSDSSLLQRAIGELRVAVKRFGPETVLDDLRQAGCLKARFPRQTTPGWIELITLNTGGGVASGDRLEMTFVARSGAQATIASQSAERFYRRLGADPPSRVRTRLSVEAGASLEWLPQETILFDQSSLDRRTDIDVASDARFLGVETCVFGRLAMGEQVRQGQLRDLIRVRRNGKLLLHDAIRMDGDMDLVMARPAVAGANRSLATVIYIAPDAGEKLDAVRTALGSAEAGASVCNGMLIARVLGINGSMLRTVVVAVLDVLRAFRPLPRVWLC